MANQVSPKVRIIWNTPEPQKIIAIAARTCYTSMDFETLSDNLEGDEISRMVHKILQNRHTSVLRHVSFMFAVSGVGRAFSHQLVRHTAGHAYEQRSQHYRKEKDFDFVQPDTIDTEEKEDLYSEVMWYTQDAYNHLLAMGVPREDARQTLPNATETQLVWTANLEAIVNFIRARACRVNTDEILNVAIQVRKLVTDIIPELKPYLGPPCFTMGMCFEGDKYYKACNKPWKQKAVLWTPEFPEKITWIGPKAEEKKDD